MVQYCGKLWLFDMSHAWHQMNHCVDKVVWESCTGASRVDSSSAPTRQSGAAPSTWRRTRVLPSCGAAVFCCCSMDQSNWRRTDIRKPTRRLLLVVSVACREGGVTHTCFCACRVPSALKERSGSHQSSCCKLVSFGRREVDA